MPLPECRYIDSIEGLEQACGSCREAGLLALDTEFERTRTYFARPALLQLYDGHTVYLLDPLALDDLSHFSSLLHRGQGDIVMHAASEDLGLLRQITGRPLTGLYDTQIAAGFCGLDYGLGYHTLVQEILGIEVSKAQTRSNWLRRPLTAAQLQYAVLDVYHLPALREWLNSRLESLGRGDWLREEMRLFVDRVNVGEAERDYQKLLKNLPDDGAARNRLLSLCEWRDALARERDVPRRQLLDDALLLALAAPAHLESSELTEIRQRHRALRRSRGGDVDAALEILAAAAQRDLPPPVQNLAGYRKLLREMQQVVSTSARRLNLPPALLASKRMLENCILHVHILKAAELPVEFRGWRRNVLAGPLLECLKHA